MCSQPRRTRQSKQNNRAQASNIEEWEVDMETPDSILANTNLKVSRLKVKVHFMCSAYFYIQLNLG